MKLLSAADITWMAGMQERAMPGTVVIERYTRISNGMGGGWEAWTAVGTAIGRIYPMTRRNSDEPVAGAQLMAETMWFATFPIGTSVDARDRLVYQDRSWEVLRVNNDQMWQTCVRCECKAFNEERRV